MEQPRTLTHRYKLLAGETDAQGRMPLTLITERLIEVASEHANALGIGYDTLIKENLGWVLTRVSIEMERYPAINEEYEVTTWVESYNRRFSERNFRIADGTGATVGYARSVWVGMNFATRTAADLTVFSVDTNFIAADIPCPIAPAPRIAPLPSVGTSAAEWPSSGEAKLSRALYRFGYSDLDFNRHVNTVRYIALLLNRFSLEHFDGHEAARFDVLFHHECRYGQNAAITIENTADNTSLCEITLTDDGATRAVAARFIWRKKD